MEHLVPTVDYYPDRTYIFTFLLSSRVFVPPHDLLARVGQICLEQRQQLEAGSDKVKAPGCPVSVPLASPLAHAWERILLRMGPGSARPGPLPAGGRSACPAS